MGCARSIKNYGSVQNTDYSELSTGTKNSNLIMSSIQSQNDLWLHTMMNFLMLVIRRLPISQCRISSYGIRRTKFKSRVGSILKINKSHDISILNRFYRTNRLFLSLATTDDLLKIVNPKYMSRYH